MGGNTKEHRKNCLKKQLERHMIKAGILFGLLSGAAFLLGNRAEGKMAGYFAMLISGIIFFLFTLWLIQKTVQKTDNSLTYLEQKFAKLSQGDFSEEIGNAGVLAEDFQMLAEYAEMMRKNADSQIRVSRQEAAALKRSAEQFHEQMDRLRQQIEERSASVEETASFLKQITAASDQLGQFSKEAHTLAEHTASRMEQSEEEVHAAYVRADGIRGEALKRRQAVRHSCLGLKDSFARSLQSLQASEEISSLAEAVMEITEKTNMLSLNASIEAAKAGQAGSGFSVVADEIRKLADDSKKSVEKIQWIAGEAHFAVDSLKEDSDQLLQFVDTKMVSDYDFFLDMADVYGNDAEHMKNMMSDLEETREKLSALAEGIAESTEQIGEAAAGGMEKLKNL